MVNASFKTRLKKHCLLQLHHGTLLNWHVRKYMISYWKVKGIWSRNEPLGWRPFEITVLSLGVIEQRGISEPGLGGKRTLVSTFFKERIPQTDRGCIAGTVYVRSTVHVGEHIQ